MNQEMERLEQIGYKCYPIAQSDNRNHIIKFSMNVFNAGYHKYKGRCDKYGISECEFYTLLLMEGFHSHEIQGPLINNNSPNEFISNCLVHFDNLLNKTPITQSQILYRQEKYYDINKIQELFARKQPFVCYHYLTTSTDDFDNSKNIKFIINPLMNGKSKAHDVYLIYNHGEEYKNVIPEYQVNFERHTQFSIDKIISRNGIYDVYCHELEDIKSSSFEK